MVVCLFSSVFFCTVPVCDDDGLLNTAGQLRDQHGGSLLLNVSSFLSSSDRIFRCKVSLKLGKMVIFKN